MGKRLASVALLNGLLVLVGSTWLLAWLPYADFREASGVTVRAEAATINEAAIARQTALLVMPFALLAGWRTWVHARKWLEGRGAGWRGVLESGACAVAVALFVLAPGIVTRPAEAPPYLLVYGGGALLLGLLVGVCLWISAVLCLSLLGRIVR